MPENVLVFENISRVVYTCLWNRFKQLGYKLTNKEKNAFSFKIKIKNLQTLHKLISADVIMHSQQLRLELFCQAFDKNKKLLAQKEFFFPVMIYKAKRTIMDSGFFEYKIKELLEKRVAPKIERYFRTFFQQASNSTKTPNISNSTKIQPILRINKHDKI